MPAKSQNLFPLFLETYTKVLDTFFNLPVNAFSTFAILFGVVVAFVWAVTGSTRVIRTLLFLPLLSLIKDTLQVAADKIEFSFVMLLNMTQQMAGALSLTLASFIPSYLLLA